MFDVRSLQNFAHAMTVVLSCHVQKFVMIIFLEKDWEQNNLSTKFGNKIEMLLVKWAPVCIQHYGYERITPLFTNKTVCSPPI